jgi:hypothetical protein
MKFLLLPLFSLLFGGSVAQGPQDCVNSLSLLVIAELFVTDTTVPREYILCPDTTYTTSLPLVPGETTENDAPITIRPNLTLKCGASGARSNNCIVTGGVGMTGTPENFNDDLDLGNVLIQGITFQALEGVNFNLAHFNGQVTIEDCAFLDSRAFPNILLDGGTVLEDEAEDFPIDEHLITTFKDCLFENNTIVSGLNVENVAALVWLPSGLQTTNFVGCAFIENDFDVRAASTEVEAIIGTENGTLSLRNNCFIDNDVDFIGVVQTFPRQPVLAVGNFGTQPERYICDFVGTYFLRPDGVRGGPICMFYDSPVCLAKDARNSGVTNPPTPPPVVPLPTPPLVIPATPAPVIPATPAPVIAPTPSPVVPATPSPIPAPTEPPISCTGFLEGCSSNLDCCSRYCFTSITSPNAGVCRGSGVGAINKSTTKLGRSSGGVGGQSMM